jgi:hypothetical protein
MTTQPSVQLVETLVDRAIDGAGAKARRFGTGFGARVIEILAVCGNAWAAANLYEELCRLSDAELERRGIPRGELHRCVFEALGPPSVEVLHGDHHRHSPNAAAVGRTQVE